MLLTGCRGLKHNTLLPLLSAFLYLFLGYLFQPNRDCFDIYEHIPGYKSVLTRYFHFTWVMHQVFLSECAAQSLLVCYKASRLHCFHCLTTGYSLLKCFYLLLYWVFCSVLHLPYLSWAPRGNLSFNWLLKCMMLFLLGCGCQPATVFLPYFYLLNLFLV